VFSALPLPARPRRRAPAALVELERLRAHPSPRVQNNVGDRLREVARSHPTLVADTCARWLRESPLPATRRIVRRALNRPHDGDRRT